MIAMLLAAVVTAVSPAPGGFADIESAIAGRRFEQARVMINRAIAGGAKGDSIDLILADLAFAEHRDAEASARYAFLVPRHIRDTALIERASLAALRSGDSARAAALLKISTGSARVSWRSWNAMGVIADDNRQFEDADTAYARALALAPEQPAVLNNMGWSRLLRGEWALAADYFDRAAALAPASVRIANNCAWAKSALDALLPARNRGESDDDYASRLNDAGVAAELRGNLAKARAAYAQAIELRGSWYDRASANLARVEGQR